MIHYIFQFLIVYTIAYTIFGIIIDIKSHGLFFSRWEKICDSIFISRDGRFKIYYSTREWKWIVMDEKLSDLQVVDSLEIGKTNVSNILKREKQ